MIDPTETDQQVKPCAGCITQMHCGWHKECLAECLPPTSFILAARASDAAAHAALKAELETMRARAIVAERHKLLDRLGKSSYQEVIEQNLRTELAECQIGCDSLKAEHAAIDCPLCGETVRQVASATLSLALWQHCNWVCRKVAALSSSQAQEP